jgi:hypothetical protein
MKVEKRGRPGKTTSGGPWRNIGGTHRTYGTYGTNRTHRTNQRELYRSAPRKFE